MYKFIAKVWIIIIFLLGIIMIGDNQNKPIMTSNKIKINTNYYINQKKESNKLDSISNNELKEDIVIKKELTVYQKEILEKSNNKISGYSLIYGNVENISIKNYIDMSCSYFEKELNIELNRQLFLALLYQESKFDFNINNGIAQITKDETIKVSNKEFYVKNRNNPISSIDWTIANFVNKYQKLKKFRNNTISEWYIIKLHNSGNALQEIRYNYKEKYPLNKEGDEAFLQAFENFEDEGKEMFKEYLDYINTDYCKEIKNSISDKTTYNDYISNGKLFSDPKYLTNIYKYYLE